MTKTKEEKKMDLVLTISSLFIIAPLIPAFAQAYAQENGKLVASFWILVCCISIYLLSNNLVNKLKLFPRG